MESREPTLYYQEVSEEELKRLLQEGYGSRSGLKNIYEKAGLEANAGAVSAEPAADFPAVSTDSEEDEDPPYLADVPTAVVGRDHRAVGEVRLEITRSYDRTADIFARDGPLARLYPGYAPRPSQIEMAKMCAEAFKEGSLAIAEAGTGTGKTFAYLVPALLGGDEDVTVISTGSKALQDQIVGKDLPFLLRALGLEHLPYMVLKGFSNYLCRRAFDRNKDKIPAQYHKAVQELVELAERTVDEELPQFSTFGEINSRLPPEVTALLTCDPVFCVKKRCPYADECFPYRARAAALRCRIIVLNHPLFLQSLSATFDTENFAANSGTLSWLLPDYRHLILDEAHSLIDYGRDAFSASFSQSEIDHFNRTLVKGLTEDDFDCKDPFKEVVGEISVAMDELKTYIDNSIGDRRVNILELKYLPPEDPEHFDGALFSRKLNTEFRDLVAKLYVALRKELRLIRSNMELLPELFEKLENKVSGAIEALEKCMNVDQKVRDLDGTVLKEPQVAIVSITSRGFSFTLTPLDISARFSEELDFLLEHHLGVVMTSATLAVKESFTKFEKELGLAVFKPQTAIVPSVFDYPNKTRLFISGEFPASGAAVGERMEAIFDRLEPVMRTVEGGIFFLTTSYAALEMAWRQLNLRFGKDRQILCQGRKYSNSALMRKFMDDGQAILIGTSSFWEGVDVPGKALSMVVIDKLPFSSPADPFFKARCDLCQEQGGKPFIQLSIPEAVIELKQGVGRLIRTESDYGVMVICDPRLETMGYGKTFLKSLPPMRRASSIEELIDFLKSCQRLFD